MTLDTEAQRNIIDEHGVICSATKKRNMRVETSINRRNALIYTKQTKYPYIHFYVTIKKD